METFRKLIEDDELPRGYLHGYYCDVMAEAVARGYKLISEKEYWAEDTKRCEKENRENPITANENIKISEYITINIFRRKNDIEPRVYLEDKDPHAGGPSDSTLASAKAYISLFGYKDMISKVDDAYNRAK
jgi:hypothetical protein